jgi:adenine-specific DNA-methyltransferase
MARKKTAKTPGLTDVDAIRHKETRANIPTEELRDFVAEEETRPGKMLYPRDPSLDPQLVWKGKDEQDGQPLEVDVVPIYIQEVIEPRVVIEAVQARKTTRPDNSGFLPGFYDDFDAIEFDRKIEFYQHGQHWANRMILGNSLQVMTSLAEKEGLKGKVQMIYIDPPYGIKFGSNWQVSTRSKDVKDGRLEDATREPEQLRAFRDTWTHGVNSYLSYIRDRLVASRELLTPNGSVFVQIGDENVHVVRCVLDEVYGSANFVSLITFKKTSGATSDFLPGTSDYILWYASDISTAKFRSLYRERVVGGEGGEAYTMVELADGTRRRATREEVDNPRRLPTGARAFRLQILTSQSQGRTKGEGAASWFPVTFEGRTFRPSMQARWKTNESGMSNLITAGRLACAGNSINYIRYHDDFPVYPYTNLWDDTQSGSAMEKAYVVQTNTRVIERCLLMTTDPGDLVLDPTCGSGTTAFVAEQWGRRWITIDTSRVALALARTRLMAAKFPYYYLAEDYPQMTQMDTDEDIRNHLRSSASSADRTPHPARDMSKGFV